jgi:putative Mg2+ transporter-C (MgtC) family protein
MPPLHLTLRLLAAAGLGAVIGLEREYRHKPAGLRTNIMIALGSALFTIISIELAGSGGTVDRVAAQIVTGVGFLGGGAILKSNDEIVHGLTTAASIWLVASLGIACGAGQWIIAIIALAIALLVLVAGNAAEKFFLGRR